MTWQPNPALYVSPEMIAELALGLDPPLDVADKYGFNPAEFGQLQAQSWFAEMVVTKRVELTTNGQTFVAKARMMAEEMYTDLFKASKANTLSHTLQVEVAKQLAGAAGMNARAAEAPSGPAFAITINLPGEAQGPSMRVVDKVASEKPQPLVIDMTPMAPLPPKPAGRTVPDFKLTDDLVGHVR